MARRAECVCFTGHRHISPEALPALTRALDEALQALYLEGFRIFLCGGALGFDLLCAERTLRLRALHPDAALWMVLPCADQSLRWNEKEKARYADLTGQADRATVLAPYYYTGCMHVRNRFMVDRASVCLCYLTGEKGGTMSTVAYALRSDLRVWNLAHDA